MCVKLLLSLSNLLLSLRTCSKPMVLHKASSNFSNGTSSSSNGLSTFNSWSETSGFNLIMSLMLTSEYLSMAC